MNADKRGWGKNIKNKEFYVVIERDEDGIDIGEVPQLKSCYIQG